VPVAATGEVGERSNGGHAADTSAGACVCAGAGIAHACSSAAAGKQAKGRKHRKGAAGNRAEEAEAVAACFTVALPGEGAVSLVSTACEAVQRAAAGSFAAANACEEGPATAATAAAANACEEGPTTAATAAAASACEEGPTTAAVITCINAPMDPALSLSKDLSAAAPAAGSAVLVSAVEERTNEVAAPAVSSNTCEPGAAAGASSNTCEPGEGTPLAASTARPQAAAPSTGADSAATAAAAPIAALQDDGAVFGSTLRPCASWRKTELPQLSWRGNTSLLQPQLQRPYRGKPPRRAGLYVPPSPCGAL
jgi:hypothetical protein